MKCNDSSEYRRATTAKEKLVLQGTAHWWFTAITTFILCWLQQVIVTFHPFWTFMQLSHVKLFGCFLKETTKIYHINF